jgi:hypothetical protein
VISDRVAGAITIVVLVVWVCNFVADVFVKEYTPDPMINIIFATIIGGAFTLRYRLAHSDKKDREQ